MAGEFVLLMLDMSKIDIPDDSSRDGVAPSMWGSYCGEEKPNIGRFVCTFCFRIIEAKFPRYDKILNKVTEVDAPVTNWRSPCCIHKVERLEVDG